MSPTTDTFKSLSMDSALELVADHFDLGVAGSDMFRNALPNSDRIAIATGYVGSGTITHMNSGVIDEYQLEITPKSITGSIRGRDNGALLLDRYYKKRYIRYTPNVVPPDQSVQVFDSFGHVIPPIPFEIGIFRASQIAKAAVESVGLTLAWETDDYYIQDTFEAVGRIKDILNNLIRPWTFVEQFRTDIIIQNLTVVIKKRVFPITSPDFTFALSDLRRSRMSLRLRKTKKVGLLTVRGARTADALSTNPLTLLLVAGEQTEEDFRETFSPAGILQSVIHTVAVYSMPGHFLLNQIREEFTFSNGGKSPTLTSRETIVNDWETDYYIPGGQTNRPKQTAGHVKRSRVDQSDPAKLFRLWETDEIGYHYNDAGFQDEESKITSKLNLAQGKLIFDKMNTKTLQVKDTLMVEQITTNMAWDDNNKKWQFLDRDTQTSGGNPAGGPGRAAPLSRAKSGQPGIGGARQLEITLLLSTDNDAQDVEISDTNLDETAMTIIVNQFKAVQGMVEVEALFDGVAGSFFARGKTIQITGITDDLGNVISIPPVVFTSIKSKYSEEGAKSEYTQQCIGFGWR